MNIRKYVKKPIPIEAVLLTAGNCMQVIDWVNHNSSDRKAIQDKNGIVIKTLEGEMRAEFGNHYIIKGVEGEFYPCQKDIFEKTYQEWYGV